MYLGMEYGVKEKICTYWIGAFIACMDRKYLLLLKSCFKEPLV